MKVVELSLVTSLLFVLLPRAASSEQTLVPLDSQGEVFGRVFCYDRTLGRTNNVNVFIVGAKIGDGKVQELANGFRKVGVAATIVWEGDFLEARSDDRLAVVKPQTNGEHTSDDWKTKNSVVYYLANAEIERVKALCTQAGLLSISGVPELVEQGHVSVSVAQKGATKEVIVNLDRMKEERHHLSAELLRIARIVR